MDLDQYEVGSGSIWCWSWWWYVHIALHSTLYPVVGRASRLQCPSQSIRPVPLEIINNCKLQQKHRNKKKEKKRKLFLFDCRVEWRATANCCLIERIERDRGKQAAVVSRANCGWPFQCFIMSFSDYSATHISRSFFVLSFSTRFYNV